MTNTPTNAAQPPNYRIYDHTGGGTEDIYADSLDDAIEQGRAWIEGGDWSGGEGKKYRTIELECCVREIVRVPDLCSIESLPGVYDVSIAAGHLLAQDGDILATVDAESLAAIEQSLSGVATLAVIDGSTLDADGDSEAVCIVRLTGEMPMMIDEEATRDGQQYDCSGEYSETLPDCEASDGEECEVVSITEMGNEFGTWSNGGTSYTHCGVCKKCGCYHVEHDAGYQRNRGESTKTITINPRDERSEAWLKETHEEDGWLPAWLAEYLDCSPTVRMTEEQAREWVAGHDDSADIDDEELEHAFAAIFDRRPDDEDRREGLWSHLCSVVSKK